MYGFVNFIFIMNNSGTLFPSLNGFVANYGLVWSFPNTKYLEQNAPIIFGFSEEQLSPLYLNVTPVYCKKISTGDVFIDSKV